MSKGPVPLTGGGVVVHSMGRVGSQSVKTALELGGNPNVLHVHHLMDVDGVYEKDEEHRAAVDGKAWGVVSVVRDPVARNLSAWWLNHRPADLDDPAAMLEHFIEEYPHQIPLQWFDWEIKGYWGIDIYAPPSSPHHPRQSYGDQQLMILRLEDFGRTWTQEMLSIFYNQPLPIPMPKVGKSGDDYKRFLGTVALPAEYGNKMYSSKYARHFYSDIELEYFRWKWVWTL